MFWPTVLSGLSLVLGLLILSGSVLMYRRYRYVADEPTATARGAAAGLTEVKGRVVAAEEPFLSPFQERPCVLCHYVFYGRRPAHGGWEPPRDTGTLGVPFYVEDETGRILIRPEGAEIKLPSPLTELSVDENRIEEISPAVAERFKERRRNSDWPDLNGERAAVANKISGLNKDRSGPASGPSCGAEVRLEEGEPVYVIGSARPPTTDGEQGPSDTDSSIVIRQDPAGDGTFKRLFGVIPYLSAAYGSIFEIYAGEEADLRAAHRREMWKGIGLGTVLFLLGLLPLLVLLQRVAGG
jgi:hypothetical protein